MNKLICASALIVAGGIAFWRSPSFSANAHHPYQNVNHRNDRGNNTGDAATVRLNDAQLASIRSGSPVATGMGNGQPD